MNVTILILENTMKFDKNRSYAHQNMERESSSWHTDSMKSIRNNVQCTPNLAYIVPNLKKNIDIFDYKLIIPNSPPQAYVSQVPANVTLGAFGKRKKERDFLNNF